MQINQKDLNIGITRNQKKDVFNRLTDYKTRKYKIFVIFTISLLIIPIVGGILRGIGILDDAAVQLLLNVEMRFWSICFWICIILLIVWLRRYRPLRESISRIIKKDGIAGLYRLIDEKINQSNPKKAFFGSDYFFIQKYGLLLKYDEIVWLYYQQTNHKIYGITVSKIRTLMLKTSYGSSITMKLSDEEIEKIAEKTPALLFGYSEINRIKYQQIVNQNKN